MESYRTGWYNGIKHALPIAKGFLRYLRWNSIESKMVSGLCTTQTEDHIFIRYCFWWYLSSPLVYTSQPYAEAMDMRPAVSYTPYTTYSRKKIGDIIRFTHFKECNLLSETCNDKERANKPDNDSTLSHLIIKE